MDLIHLVSQPEPSRDEDWERAFFEAIKESRLEILSPEARPGPDGWPYLFAATSSKATEPALRILEWLSERGIGLVINVEKELPDYIFTYGMIWNFRERGEFLTPVERSDLAVGEVEIPQGQEFFVGQPSPTYLPDYVRKILRDFFQDQGIHHPKVMMMSSDKVNYDLCFSLESLGSPPEAERADLAEALAWFLPQHYAILLMSENNISEFKSL